MKLHNGQGAGKRVCSAASGTFSFQLERKCVGGLLGRMLPVSACLLMAAACSVGQRHTPDSVLERNFFKHEAEFNRLLSDVLGDDQLEMVGFDEIRYTNLTISDQASQTHSEPEGLKARWGLYKKQLKALGIRQAFIGRDGVAFKVDEASIINGASYKGYAFDLVPCAHRKSSLDWYRISPQDRDGFGNFVVCKPFKGQWSLYLSVDGR
jgi:hypothetical protein